MIRYVAATAHEARIWGVDIWSSAILWCQDHLCPPCSFAAASVLRPGGRLYFSIHDQHAVPTLDGEGDPAAYAGYYRRTAGKAYWDSWVAKLTHNAAYERFRRGEAYMMTVGRSMKSDVMWNTDVLCERLSWGYRPLSVSPRSCG